MDKIKPKTKMTIVQMDKKQTEDSYFLNCFFEKLGGKGIFLVSAPYIKGLQVSIETKTKLILSYNDKTASYSVEAQVMGRERSETGSLSLKMKQLSDVVRTQRRDDFRIPHVENCSISRAIIGEDGTRTISQLKAATIDLSGGGVSCRANENLVMGEVVLFTLPTKEETLKIPGEIRWTYQNTNMNISWKYNIGIKFIFKNINEKEAFIKFVFEMARNKRRKDIDFE